MRTRIGGSLRGFTLIELMITVAIVGILAAVAIPVFSGYMQKSKASEAFTLLQGIREKEESFFGEFKRYTGDIVPTPYDESDATLANICGNTHDWNIIPGSPWLELGFNPDGPTYYTYSVESAYGAAASFDFPATPGSTAPAIKGPWFRAKAYGDLDCSGIPTTFWVTSVNKTIYHDDTDQENY